MKRSTHTGKCANALRAAKVDQILIVDNDPVFLALLAKFLKKDGFHVLTARDGALALKILKSVTPDVILLDLVMPNLSGDRLCRMIREMDTAVKDIPIIIVTAVATEGVKVDTLGMGANDCVAKASFNQTYRRIREALSRLEKRSRKKGARHPAVSAEVPTRSIIGELISINRNHEAFMSNISEGRLELTEEGRIIFANSAAISLLGQPELDLISAKVTDFFRKEDRAAVSKLLSFKKRRQPADGSTSFRLSNSREVTVKALHVTDEDRYTVILRDVTEQKGFERALLKAYADLETRVAERTAELAKANEALHAELRERRKIEEMLQHSRNTLRSVFDSISDPLIMVDGDLRIRMANRATVDYFHSADYLEILGKFLPAVAQDHFAPDLLSSVQSAVLRFEEASFESKRLEKSGKYEKVFIYPTHEEYRVSGSAIVRISDVTKEKILTIELIQQEKLATLGLLVSSLTHEINNPTNFILSNARMLHDAWQDLDLILAEFGQDLEEYSIGGFHFREARQILPRLLDGIIDGSHRIRNILTGLREFAREEKTPPNQKVDINTVLEKSFAILQNQIRQHTNHFHSSSEPDLHQVRGSLQQLEQVVINLTMNALQSLPSKEFGVYISTFRDKAAKSVVVKIRDQGIGMPPEVVKRIFDPFFTTRLESGGTGLGLSICYSIIKEHLGTIEVESEPGKGTSVYVRIPTYRHRESTYEQHCET